MNKLESLQRLDKWGYNIPPFVVYKEGMKSADLIAALDPPPPQGKRYGIRTWSEEKKFLLPFICNLDAQQAIDSARSLAPGVDGNVFIQEYIPPDLYFQGNVLLRSNRSGIVEIWREQATLREMEGKSPDFSFPFERLYEIPDEDIRLAVEELIDIPKLLEAEECVVEFTVFKKCVGTLSAPLVVWEIRNMKGGIE